MNLANAGSAAAYNVGNAQAQGAMNVGQARASGQVGQANAFSNALGQIAGYAMQYPMQNAMMQQNAALNNAALQYYQRGNRTGTGTAAVGAAAMQQPIFGYDPYTGRRANYLTNT
jgi:hypothetical protein